MFLLSLFETKKSKNLLKYITDFLVCKIIEIVHGVPVGLHIYINKWCYAPCA